MKFIRVIGGLHGRFFGGIEKLAGSWFLPLLARLVFLAVLFSYFLNSFATKVGEGAGGFFQVQDGAYFQILTESGLEPFGFDTANVPFLLDLVVYAGTYAELLLPLLIVAGLFTRVAALGMIVFVLVQSFVDINLHGVGAETAGMLFDRDSASLIWDQRTLWVFLLTVLVVRGGGALSLDALATRLWKSDAPEPANGPGIAVSAG